MTLPLTERELIQIWIDSGPEKVLSSFEGPDLDLVSGFLWSYKRQMGYAAVAIETLLRAFRTQYGNIEALTEDTVELAHEVGRQGALAIWKGEVANAEEFVINFMTDALDSEEDYQEMKTKLGIMEKLDESR